MKTKRPVIGLIMALIFTLLPANVMTSYADVGDAPTYIYADEDDDQLFVYWDEVDWDDGFMEESIAAQKKYQRL